MLFFLLTREEDGMQMRRKPNNALGTSPADHSLCISIPHCALLLQNTLIIFLQPTAESVPTLPTWSGSWHCAVQMSFSCSISPIPFYISSLFCRWHKPEQQRHTLRPGDMWTLMCERQCACLSVCCKRVLADVIVMQLCPLGSCRIHTSDCMRCGKAPSEHIKDVVRQLNVRQERVLLSSWCSRILY